ncbi:hypothetical protein [Pontibacter harenae]|uniref:hypothetical protein n=1 Tax=Pontibacter harenae TaxID=2894083 RepID=UPI001E5CA496|nr:hypothetical protein [Pontibacter harenae]MCC9168793.1 hypothetical protein [Pontibacter harenae]
MSYNVQGQEAPRLACLALMAFGCSYPCLFSLFCSDFVVLISFFISGKTSCSLAHFLPLNFLLSGALGGGDAVNTGIDNVAADVRLAGLGKERLTYHWPLYCRNALKNSHLPKLAS